MVRVYSHGHLARYESYHVVITMFVRVGSFVLTPDTQVWFCEDGYASLLRPCRGAVCTMEAVSSLSALARRGYCAPTKSFAAGDCAVGGMGTWPLHGLTPLASCVQR